MRQVWTLVILWCLRKIMRETWFVVHLGGRSESEQLKALNLQARAKEKSKGHETGKMLRSLALMKHG